MRDNTTMEMIDDADMFYQDGCSPESAWKAMEINYPEYSVNAITRALNLAGYTLENMQQNV